MMLSRKRQRDVIAAIEAADPTTPQARLYDELFPPDSRTPTRGEFEQLWRVARRRPDRTSEEDDHVSEPAETAKPTKRTKGGTR